ncbi:MAG TPA: DUF4255 domain-containing protein [Pilimelia sp.]|nr:DUF4255 domain-containing protein [Pilimelia sp.]
MIHDIDEALRRLVEAAGRQAKVTVVFDAPTKEWAARRNAPNIVDCYLYDIREDLRRRSRGLRNEYADDGVVRARLAPPRFVKLSYLVTVWAKDPSDEHRLLSDLLVNLIGLPAVPRDLLGGAVAATGLAVPMTVALPPPEDRAFADVWSALGGELKPSLDVVISAPVAAEKPVPAERPARDGVRVGLSDTRTGAADPPVGHHVERAGEGRPRVSMRRVRRV